MPLGSLLGPPKAFLGSLWTPKTLKNQWFFNVFAIAAFWVFEALDGPLGPILAPSCADLVPKLTPKWPPNWSKKCSETSLKNHPQIYQKWTNFGPQNGAQNGARWRTTLTGKFGREFLKRSCFQDGSKMAQDGPEKPKIASWEPSWVFIGCLGRPWTPKNLIKHIIFQGFCKYKFSLL